MSGDTGRPSSREVAHEAEDTRAHLASTLEQLRTNLKPENVMEEVVNNAKIGASSVADNLFGVARQYPIPSALIAAGSALVLRLFPRHGEAPAAPVGGHPPLLRDPVAFDPSVRTSPQPADALQAVSRYIPRDRAEVRSKLSYLLEEQPLILGAIGLAVGAAIGAALPMTETEDKVMGSTAHRLRESAQDAARHEVEGLRTAASEAIDNVRHSASDNLHGFVQDVGTNARHVVDKAGETFTPTTRDV